MSNKETNEDKKKEKKGLFSSFFGKGGGCCDIKIVPLEEIEKNKPSQEKSEKAK